MGQLASRNTPWLREKVCAMSGSGWDLSSLFFYSAGGSCPKPIAMDSCQHKPDGHPGSHFFELLAQCDFLPARVNAELSLHSIVKYNRYFAAFDVMVGFCRYYVAEC